MIASQVVETVVRTVSTIILARLLVPEDFGLTTLAGSLAAMLWLLRSFSFDLVLIKRQNAGREEYDTAWTFNVIFSALIAILLALAAHPFARIYGDPRLIQIVWLIALSYLIEGFQNVGIVDFRKYLQFRKEFLFTLLRRLGGLAITVVLGVTYRNYWALVLGMVASHVLSTALSYVVHPYRPRFDMSAWREIFGFSKWNAVNAVAHAVSIRSGDFLVGKFAGPSGLGLFTLADQLAFLPSSSLGAPINRAVYPGYAKTAHDLGRLRDAFYRVISLIAVVMMPAGVGLAATADSLVPILLGKQWLAAIPLVAVLAFRGLIHGLVSNVPYVYLALGKPELATYALVARAIILLPMLWVGLRAWGLFGAACAFTASMALEIPISLLITRHQLKIRITTVLRALLRPAVAAGLMAISVRWLSLAWMAPEATAVAVLRLGVLVGAGVATYVAAIVSLWRLSGRPRGAEQTVLEALKSQVATWNARTGDAR